MRPAVCAVALGLFCSATAKTAADKVLCGTFDRVTVGNSPYLYGQNEWGNDGSGEQCMSINSVGTVFNATWQWADNPLKAHSFPNIDINSAILPMPLSDLTNLRVRVNWDMFPTEPQYTTLDEVDAVANAVVDMFVDVDPKKASTYGQAAWEIMIWLGMYGNKFPLGYYEYMDPPAPTMEVGGVNFTLYSQPNGAGQDVYTWLASENITSFDEDISPMVLYMVKAGIINSTEYLGIMEFGTETFHSSANVSFSVTDYNLSISSTNNTPVSTPFSSTPSKNAAVVYIPNAIFLLATLGLTLYL